MSTHIFTRLGYWEQSIDWNTRSAKAALQMAVGDAVSLHYFHAVDYLVYANLQIGEDQKAIDWKERVDALKGPFQINPATAYALAAMPCRIQLERKEWNKAAALVLPHQDKVPWKKFPHLEAFFYYGKGIGAARNVNKAMADEIIDRMNVLIEAMGDDPSAMYWVNRMQIQQKVVDAWNEYTSGDKKIGVSLMEEAVEMEDKSEKNPVTPGELLPAKELLGDMYLDAEMPQKAFNAYESSLEGNPNRCNTFYGAALSSEQKGDQATAVNYYQKILELAATHECRKQVIERAKKGTEGVI